MRDYYTLLLSYEAMTPKYYEPINFFNCKPLWWTGGVKYLLRRAIEAYL